MNVTIGIDPGLTGAIAVLVDGELVDAFDMPTAGAGKKRIVSAALLANDLRTFADNPLVVVEKVHSMPGQGVSSMFKFGRTLGVIEGVVTTLGYRLQWVTPQAWKKAAGLIGTDKDASRLAALERWPRRADLFSRKQDGGRADAAFIALWGVPVTRVVMESPSSADAPRIDEITHTWRSAT